MKTKLVGLMALTCLPLVALLALNSCEDDDVGVPCKMDQAGGDDETGVEINAQAVDCRSRLCIQVGKASNPSLCTAPCETDDDCPDPPPDKDKCSQGFKCRIGQTVEGGLQCCKLCVCADYLTNATKDPLAEHCQGKAQVCPNI